MKYTVDEVASIDRNARAYGYEIGRGHPLVEQITSTSSTNPFMDEFWRDHMEEPTVTAPHPLGTREYLTKLFEGRHQDTIDLIKQFSWSHLPAHLQEYSRTLSDIAVTMIQRLPDGLQLTTGLHKLLEAKDCFVRAAIDAQAPAEDHTH